jgi:hypothetical protein
MLQKLGAKVTHALPTVAPTGAPTAPTTAPSFESEYLSEYEGTACQCNRCGSSDVYEGQMQVCGPAVNAEPGCSETYGTDALWRGGGGCYASPSVPGLTCDCSSGKMVACGSPDTDPCSAPSGMVTPYTGAVLPLGTYRPACETCRMTPEGTLQCLCYPQCPHPPTGCSSVGECNSRCNTNPVIGGTLQASELANGAGCANVVAGDNSPWGIEKGNQLRCAEWKPGCDAAGTNKDPECQGPAIISTAPSAAPTSAPADPTCETGIKSHNPDYYGRFACCPKECSHCGGPGCSTGNQCCTPYVADPRQYGLCSVKMPPCSL